MIMSWRQVFLKLRISKNSKFQISRKISHETASSSSHNNKLISFGTLYDNYDDDFRQETYLDFLLCDC